MSDNREASEGIGPQSSISEGPSRVVPAPVLGASILPFNLLAWEDFERLQWRILRDVEGLRHARMYGTRGQAQYGLDIIAFASDGTGTALQSKRYETFGVSDLDKAVEKLQIAKERFEIQRFIIGVGCDANRTEVVEALIKHQKNFAPREIELWDQGDLSEILRGESDLVIQFFGEPTAQAFCLPYAPTRREVAEPDAVAIAEALARTPEKTTGAGEMFRAAEDSESADEQALALIEEGQRLLREAGFAAHAAQKEEERARVLGALGRSHEAARVALDEIWAALDTGRTTTAEILSHRLRRIAAGAADDDAVAHLVSTAEAAILLHLNPVGEMPPIDTLIVDDLDDGLRLAVVASETALANGRRDWLVTARPQLSRLAANEAGDSVVRTRLRLVLAEAGDDWVDILHQTRTRQLGFALQALVTARYARRRGLNEHFEEAENLWSEAVGDASLAKNWSDASTWVFSHRAFRTRWRIMRKDELLAAEIALSDMGPSIPVLRGDRQAYAAALEALRTRDFRGAAINAQRALRQAIAGADLVGEERARRTLGAALVEFNEPQLAAHHFALGTDLAAMRDLAQRFPREYIDVEAALNGPNYWTVGTAFALVAAEADVVPDEALQRILASVQSELEGAESGKVFDPRAFATSRYRGALKTLAALADRLTKSQAEDVMTHFESQAPLEQNQSRFHDEDEAMAVARIARSQPDIADRAVAHLVSVLVRSQAARNATTVAALDASPDIANAKLAEEAADGELWAKEVLAARSADAPSGREVEDALQRLTTPIAHTHGVYSVGSNAIGDSLLVQTRAPHEREASVRELISRGHDTLIAGSDKGEYLLAAANLVNGLSANVRAELFSEALRLSTSMTPAEFEVMEEIPGFQPIYPTDVAQGKALYLAAHLADGPEQQLLVKQQAFLLLSSGKASDFWPAQALRKLDAVRDEDIGFLAGYGWTPRVLAAQAWVKSPTFIHIGRKLAMDDDVRVRRALAMALPMAPGDERLDDVRSILAEDPAYSVRSAMKHAK